ncbi:Uncharacterised protein [Brevundimonas diminuta]|uniref:HEPN/Toprim-associated domain-containing protein n=1 Tax=Brevundimonas diminuta TaxID=293 RepID=UPI000D81D6AF|nr:HEPN/Toprim-associated domain-containing protein [Brevundimonas diminuta]SPU44590.1 Uncharacterised protein [Brevundimonas diminuta]
MGTSIELELGGIGLDYAKNHMGPDHGHLFQEGDRTRRPVGGIVDEDGEAEGNGDVGHDEDRAAEEAAFVRPLSRVLPRLNLLGFTLGVARREYEAVVAEQVEQSSWDHREDKTKADYMTFDEFCAFCDRFEIADLDDTYIGGMSDEEEEKARGRFNAVADELARIPHDTLDRPLFWSERSFFGASICILSAYSMLQVFGRGATNQNAEVIWQYGPIVEAGWVPLEMYQPGIRRKEALLIATEGTSDARILRRAVDVLRPDIADFLRFIDVDQSHPFPGTGNLVKFAEGLVHIDVLNRIVFVLDNDAEGIAGLRKIEAMAKPINMRAISLPALDALKSFPARGPEGLATTDINERAAAIECYLDLNLPGRPDPVVVWSNYKKDIDRWHGGLDYKETYTKHFLEQKDTALLDGTYQTDKLEAVLDAILAEAMVLADGDLSADWMA